MENFIVKVNNYEEFIVVLNFLVRDLGCKNLEDPTHSYDTHQYPYLIGRFNKQGTYNGHHAWGNTIQIEYWEFKKIFLNIEQEPLIFN